VILPLLWAVGYERREIVSRVADNLGQFPDYTLLPATDCTWYLEAKDWQVPLEDKHAQQSLNYANTSGRRWVVLTNGQVWRLYDNRLEGTATEKLVVEVQLRDVSAIEEFLQAISKESVTSGGLERFATKARLAAVLQAQLRSPDSEIVRAIWNALKRQPGLSNVARGDVVAYFEGLRNLPPEPPPEPKPVEERKPVEAEAGIGLDVLADRAAELATHKKPEMLTFPDNSPQVTVRTWKDVAVEVVKWLGQRNQLPALPFRGRKGGKSYFLNSVPHHETKSMNVYQKIDLGEQSVYMDTNRSSADLLHCLQALCETRGVSPSGFVVKVRGSEGR